MLADSLQLLLAAVILALCIRPLGFYIARVLSGRELFLSRIWGGLERGIYRLCGINPDSEMGWKSYVGAVLWLGLLGGLVVFLLLVGQGSLPLNPREAASLPMGLAANVAVSFVTNTNWQSYSGEDLSLLSQMVGLTVQNFLSAATGIVVAAALFRGFQRKQTELLGNPYVDLVRVVLYLLLPMSIVFALLLASQGVVQTFSASATVQLLQGGEGQVALGPVASQVAIKMLGSNGGGFFNANGAHPFENPNAISNFLQLISILLIPAALTLTFGLMVGDRRQGYAVLAAMVALFIPLVGISIAAELNANPRLEAAFSGDAVNLEGKELRFGPMTSAVWGVATTATSNGSVNMMHDSAMPLSGFAQMLAMQMGEVSFGGVGSGIYGMLLFVLLTVFIGGLMVGRTPEYLSKKIGAFEIKMVSLAILAPALVTLLGLSLAILTEEGRAAISNPGPHGFSQLLYALTSAANNNGSAFGGVSVNTPFYNTLLAVCMLAGRYGVIIPVLAIAGALAQKNKVPVSAGTLPTHTLLFVVLLVSVVVLLGVLTYVPALALGPVAEHVKLFGGAL